MTEPVSAVSSAPLPMPGVGGVSLPGGDEAVGRPLPVPTSQEVAGFDDVARALRAEAMTAPPVPRGKDVWSRATSRVGGVMDQLSRLDAKIHHRIVESGRPSDIPVIGLGPRERPGYPETLSYPERLSHPEGWASDAVDRPVGYPDALEDAMEEMQAHIKVLIKNGLEVANFQITVTLIKSMIDAFTESIKKLAEGNG